MSFMDDKIKRFLAKKTKAARVLQLLLAREYVTGDDIINIYRLDNPECKHSYTTCPQGLIKAIRDYFGYDFVQDVSIPFKVTLYDSKGKPYQMSDTYKKYFLKKMEGGIDAA